MKRLKYLKEKGAGWREGFIIVSYLHWKAFHLVDSVEQNLLSLNNSVKCVNIDIK